MKTIRAIYEESPGYINIPPAAVFTDSTDVFEWFQGLDSETKEYFLCLHLDTKNICLCVDIVSVGSLNSTTVHPREVFKAALLSSACSVILVHNHPTGDPEPSREDLDLTQRLEKVGVLLGIPVLDHVIIGKDDHYSFAKHKGGVSL